MIYTRRMSNRHDKTFWIVWLLLASLFLRGAAFAHAYDQRAADPLPALAAGAAHCHEEGAGQAGPQAMHDASACQIACELGTAAALVPLPILKAPAAPAVRHPRVPILALAEATPPDHPPPI